MTTGQSDHPFLVATAASPVSGTAALNTMPSAAGVSETLALYQVPAESLTCIANQSQYDALTARSVGQCDEFDRGSQPRITRPEGAVPGTSCRENTKRATWE